MERIPVIHVTECLAGGVLTFLLDVVQAMPERENYIVYSARSETPVAVERLFPGSVHMERLRWAREIGWRDVQVAGQLIARLRAFPVGLVHAHSSKAGGVVRGLRAMGAIHLPVIYTPHGWAFQQSTLRHSTRRLYITMEQALGRVSINVAASYSEAQIGESLGIPMRFVEKPMEVALAKVPWSRRRGACTIGRIEPQKNPALFVEYSRRLRSLGWVEDVTWIGAGSMHQQVSEAQIAISGWTSMEEVRRRVALSRVYVHTALWEAWPPYAVLEAAATGTPVIAITIVRGLTDLGGGVLFASNAEEAAGVTVALANDESRWNEMSDQAAGYVRDHHSYQKFREDLEFTYRKALGDS